MWQQLTDSLTPHREALQNTVGAYLACILDELKKANERAQRGRPSIFDRWGSRPFAATGEKVTIIQTSLNQGLALETVWFQAKHEKAAEPLPAFLLQINGIPVWALSPTRILEPEEWGVYTEKFSGDLIVPRGSILEIVPMFTGKFTIKGGITFIRQLLPQQEVPAGGTAQGDDINLRAHSGEHEPDRYLPDTPGSLWGGVDVPDSVEGANQEGYGGLTPEVSEPAGLFPET